MMIKLKDTHYIAADHIADVRINEHANAVLVRTKDGGVHVQHPESGDQLRAVLERLVGRINLAFQVPRL